MKRRYIQLRLFSPDPDDTRTFPAGRVVRDTAGNREWLRRAIRLYNRKTAKRDDIVYCAAVFEVDRAGKAVAHA